MKNTIKALALLMIMTAVGFAQAHAVVPSIDGSATTFLGEWTNDDGLGHAYPYYLEVLDPNEFNVDPLLNIPDAYDIRRVVLLQELTAVSGDGDFDNDGIYLLIETYADPSLVDLDGLGTLGARLEMSGDFNADGVQDIFLTHTSPFGVLDGSSQSVLLINNTPIPPGPPVGPLSLPAANFSIVTGNSTGTGCASAFAPCTPITAIEYFIPAGFVGTPPSPPGVVFPFSFVGSITYDNGGQQPDDVTVGTLIPEPSTMFMLGAGLLGLLGLGRRKV